MHQNQLQPVNQGQQYHCGICKKPYTDQTDNVVQCDRCDKTIIKWLHFDCVGLTEEPETFCVTSVSTLMSVNSCVGSIHVFHNLGFKHSPR